jgi:squalene cyclase
MGFRDWFVMGHVNAALIAATVFLFKHSDTMNFATWGTVLVTVIGVYHWLVIRDSKEKDA